MSRVRTDEAGVTCALCCHNSAQRLPVTLECLAKQELPAGLAWEVLVIDNASSDDTAVAAQRSWSGTDGILRVVREPQAGLSYARMRALAEARFGVITFIDDDNHVAADWVSRVWGRMNAQQDLGILAGRNLPLPESDPPPWFAEVRRFWAVEGQPKPGGDITHIKTFPSGAGLTLRKRAFQELVDAGFHFSLTGRTGGGMAAGEDHELVIGLLLNNWKAWHDPDLVLHHFIPNGRLTWDYARRLMRGVGEAGAMMDAYLYLWMEREGNSANALQRHWAWRALATFREWAGLLLSAAARGGLREGNSRLLMAERAGGRLSALVRMRGEYERRRKRVAASPWLNPDGKPAL